MIALTDRATGSKLWVHESRLDEYLAAGYKLAAPPKAAADAAPEKKPAARKKTAAKK